VREVFPPLFLSPLGGRGGKGEGKKSERASSDGGFSSNVAPKLREGGRGRQREITMGMGVGAAFTRSFSVSGISIDLSVSGPRNPIKTFPFEAYLSHSRRSDEVRRVSGARFRYTLRRSRRNLEFYEFVTTDENVRQ